MTDMHKITTATTITTGDVDALELALMAARKADEVVAYLVPYGPDYTAALAVQQGLVTRLRERGLVVKVTTRGAPNGLALVLEDVTPAAPPT